MIINLMKIQMRFKDFTAIRLLLISGLVGLSLTLNAQVTASGGETAINVTTAESQRVPAISMNSAEQYVITWQSWAQDGDGWGVYASTFDLGAGTNPVSETIINNGQTVGSQLNPDAAMASDGDFVVVYQDEVADTDGWGIYFSMLTINGTRNISDLILNQTTAGNQRHPAVAVTNSDSYVVVWESEGQIYGRLINSTGALVGNEFQISANDVGVSHLYPDVATKADGSFIVAWQAINTSGQSFIVAREMTSAGVAVADAFGVSSDSTLSKANPAIATSSADEFVITWSQYISETNITDVFATKYDNSGSVALSEFRVNAARANAQNQVDVGMTDAGAMVFSYTDFDKDGDKAGVFLNVFDDEGTLIVNNMQLNSTTDDYQMSASIAFNTDNGPLIGTWQDGLYASDTARDGSGYGIYSREFAIVDITKPTVVTQDLTVYLNSAGTASITAADVDGGSTDNVGINSLFISASSFACADVGENDVILTAFDAVGNRGSGNATITVVDSVRPTAIAQDVSLILDAAGFASITVDDIDNGSTDNCSISTRTLSKTNYDSTDVGVNTVELEITDASGNTRTATAQVTISKRDQAITFGALANVTFGDAPFDLTATSDSGLGITYTSSDEKVVMISGSTVTIVGAGTANITASQAGTAVYNAATDVVQSITVDKADQTITFGALAAVTFGDAPFDLTATASSGLGITYTSSDETVATVSGSTVTIVGAGIANITASQAGNDDYNAATNVVQVLTVNSANQTITFGALAAVTFGDAPFDLTATASSGLGVTYASSDETVVTISGSTVTIVGAGTVNITASQAGNDDYNAATDVVQSLTVNKANQTITFGALAAVTFGDAPFALTGTASSGLGVTYTSSNENVVTISGSTVTIVGAGTANITASQNGDDDYNAATNVVQSLTVNKANQTITFGALADATFGDAPIALTGTASSGLAVDYESDDPTVAFVDAGNIVIVGAGTTTIFANQSGNSNYNAAPEIEQTLTVNKADQTITFGALTAVTFGDAPFDLTGTTDSGLGITYTSSDETVVTISGSTVTIVGAGTANITASQAGDDDYNAATNVVQSLTVNKANQTITFGALADVTFGDAPFALTGTASSGLGLTYVSSDETVVTISGGTVTVVGAGTANITASQAGNDDYNAATDVVQSINVNKSDQTITFDALADVTFGDAPFNLTATTSSGLGLIYVSSDETVATINGSTVIIVGAGTTNITASQGGDANYNAAADVVQSLTVNKAEQVITFAALSNVTQGDPSFDLVASGGASGNAVTFTSSDPLVASVSGNTVTIGSFGNTTITASQAGNDDYEAAVNVAQVLTVDKLFIWNGAAWNNAGIPSVIAGDKVRIDGNYTVSNSGIFSASELNVTAGNTLMVDNLETLIVEGDLNSDGLLHVTSGSSLVPATIPSAQVTGTGYQIDRTTTFDNNTGRYSIVGSPVQNAGFAQLGSNALVYGYDESELYDRSEDVV